MPDSAVHEIPAQYLLSAQAPPERTLVDILAATATAYPDAPAIDDGDRPLTYSQLHALVRRGVRPGSIRIATLRSSSLSRRSRICRLVT